MHRSVPCPLATRTAGGVFTPLRLVTVGLLAAAAACLAMAPARAVTIDWVTVGDPGNTGNPNAEDWNGDPRALGAVADAFRIMKYEMTNDLYTDFLNAVAATDPYLLYNTNMGSNVRGGITRSGSPGSFVYAVKSNMGDKPVNWVSWFDAARMANWLQNGQGSGSTETGAYTLGGATEGPGPARNSNAQFYIPTVDEWYKAAYYKGGSTNAGYWAYATQSDTVPTAVTAGSTGIGSAGNAGNFANYDGKANWNGRTAGNVTTVGTNGGPSAYGAYDMSGNVEEWNDLDGNGTSTYDKGLWGGSWYNNDTFSLSSSSSGLGSGEYFNRGFRLASPIASPSAVPEIDPAGMGSVLAFVGGALGLLERRRRRV